MSAPPIFIAGFGCRRGCTEASLRTLMQQALAEHGFSITQVCGLASIDRKHDEAGLLALADHLALPLALFSASQLAAFEHRLSERSDITLRVTGSAGVAEAAAMAQAEALSGGRAELIIRKRSNTDASFALARVL